MLPPLRPTLPTILRQAKCSFVTTAAIAQHKRQSILLMDQIKLATPLLNELEDKYDIIVSRALFKTCLSSAGLS